MAETLPTCVDPIGNCAECCHIFLDPALREKFGYQEVEALCQCHDICVQDVRLICAQVITHSVPLPGQNGRAAGCRGGRVITAGLPLVCHNVRVVCAQEELAPNCMAVDNRIGLEIVLKVKASPPVYFLVNTEVVFTCPSFWSFPQGDLVQGEDLAKQLRFIDGSSQTIIIEDCQVINDGCPRLEVKLKVIDKLWKHENLLISGLRPYPENVTVKQEFNNFHSIGPCDEDC